MVGNSVKFIFLQYRSPPRAVAPLRADPPPPPVTQLMPPFVSSPFTAFCFGSNASFYLMQTQQMQQAACNTQDQHCMQHRMQHAASPHPRPALQRCAAMVAAAMSSHECLSGQAPAPISHFVTPTWGVDVSPLDRVLVPQLPAQEGEGRVGWAAVHSAQE